MAAVGQALLAETQNSCGSSPGDGRGNGSGWAPLSGWSDELQAPYAPKQG